MSYNKKDSSILLSKINNKKSASAPQLRSWPVSGIRVLAKREDEEHLFVQEEIDHLAQDRTKHEQTLKNLGWPILSDGHNAPHQRAYSDYYCSVLADTIQQLHYGYESNCTTKRCEGHSIGQLMIRGSKKRTGEHVIRCLNKPMLERAQTLAQNGNLHICGINPMNNRSIGGGAFIGASYFEEDLFRASELGISLIHYVRDNNDLIYNTHSKKPHYYNNQCLNQGEALFSQGVRVLKRVSVKPGIFGYAKKFVDLPKEKQFQLSFVSSAPIPLAKPRKFTKEERASTKNIIRAQLSAMIEAQVDIALLTDFGCENYNNDPKEIADLYKELLLIEGYIHFFSSIEFTIGDIENCKIFNQVFNQIPTNRLNIQNEEDVELFYSNLAHEKQKNASTAVNDRRKHIQKAQQDLSAFITKETPKLITVGIIALNREVNKMPLDTFSQQKLALLTESLEMTLQFLNDSSDTDAQKRALSSASFFTRDNQLLYLGIGITILGLALLTISIAVTVVSFGLTAPISIGGLTLGASLIAGQCAITAASASLGCTAFGLFMAHDSRSSAFTEQTEFLLDSAKPTSLNA